VNHLLSHILTIQQKIIDQEVSKLIESQYQRALNILTENKEKLTLLAEKLLESEVIFKEDLISIFGERQWKVDELPLVKNAEKMLEDEPAKQEEDSNIAVEDSTQNQEDENK